MKFCQLLCYPDAHLRAVNEARALQPEPSYKEAAIKLAENPPDATLSWVPELGDAGHNAVIIVANDSVSQRQWVAEKLTDFRSEGDSAWMRDVVIEQLRKFKVDALCILDPVTFDSRFIRALKGRPRWIVGHTTALTETRVDWREFDLILSPHAACVRQAWQWGARDAQVFPSGFPRATAEAVFQVPVTLDVVYFGRWVPGDAQRNELITALAETAARQERPFSLGLHVDVPAGSEVPPAVRQLNTGPVHGVDRYRALHSAAICVTGEPDDDLGETMPAGAFESTGLGVFTLARENGALAGFFKPD
ncbi:MAG: hypothetical protein JWO94_828, partial [Verrucomicrobiaceae bacterium]|nr:hypothetical protein [Verrucomicrobiaceae bacterium]